MALVKGNAMCGWRGMHLAMEGASGRAQLGAVPRGLREKALAGCPVTLLDAESRQLPRGPIW